MSFACPELIDILPVPDIKAEEISRLADISPPCLPGPDGRRCLAVWPNGLVAIVPRGPSSEQLRLAYCDAKMLRALIGTRLGAELLHARRTKRPRSSAATAVRPQ